jgi:hypothetical protein
MTRNPCEAARQVRECRRYAEVEVVFGRSGEAPVRRVCRNDLLGEMDTFMKAYPHLTDHVFTVRFLPVPR